MKIKAVLKSLITVLIVTHSAIIHAAEYDLTSVKELLARDKVDSAFVGQLQAILKATPDVLPCVQIESTTQATYKNYWGDDTVIVAEDVRMTGLFELTKGGRFIAEISPDLCNWIGGASKLSAERKTIAYDGETLMTYISESAPYGSEYFGIGKGTISETSDYCLTGVYVPTPHFFPIEFYGSTFQFSGYSNVIKWPSGLHGERNGNIVTLRRFAATKSERESPTQKFPSEVLVVDMSPYPVIVRYEKNTYDLDTNEIVSTRVYEVERFYRDQANPIALPERVRYREWDLADRSGRRNTEREFVSDISYKLLSQVNDSDFHYEFPVGANIVDERFRIEYQKGETAQSVLDSMKSIQ